jgi:uncharacterized protein YndB with AHSA1/START domain
VKSTCAKAAGGVLSVAAPKASTPSMGNIERSPRPIVYTEIFEPFPDVESVVTQTLAEEGRKTRLTVRALYPSMEVRDSVLKTGMEKGAGISYDRLEDLVRELQA